MPYTPTTWSNEVPASSPVKYEIVDDIDGQIAASATIAPVTDITPGTPLNATNMNKIEAALQTTTALAEAALPRTAAIVYRSSALTLAHNTGTIVDTYNTIQYNPGGLWSGDNPSRISIATTGLYIVHAYANFASSADGLRIITFIQGISSQIRTKISQPVAATDRNHELTALVYILGGNYLQLQLTQSSGGDLDVTCHFAVARVG